VGEDRADRFKQEGRETYKKYVLGTDGRSSSKSSERKVGDRASCEKKAIKIWRHENKTPRFDGKGREKIRGEHAFEIQLS